MKSSQTMYFLTCLLQVANNRKDPQWQYVRSGGIDSINHLAGNYLVQINDIIATVFVYATATHYKESATKGKTREFFGTYFISLMKHGIGWRIYQFKYDLKFKTGNIELT